MKDISDVTIGLRVL